MFSLEDLIKQHGPQAYYIGHCKCGAVLDYDAQNNKDAWEHAWATHLANEIRKMFSVS